MELLLYSSDTCETIILKCIEAIRELEKSKGFTDEEISYKYTHGMCGHLATAIRFILQACGKSDFRSQEFSLTPIGNHVMLKTGNFLCCNETYYDISGKFSSEQIEDYINNLSPYDNEKFVRINADKHNFTCIDEMYNIVKYDDKPLFSNNRKKSHSRRK